MGARKICVAVNKNGTLSIGLCASLWGAVCEIFAVSEKCPAEQIGPN